ncbi:TetR/AcrR family transcriptional regulator [Burkholderia sp. BCC1999]|uniref:TetR/AcrR family transcriptional regulator n=1 Tax=Burkholderia sp. BCC1999 TaxID=2817448 RepID=UPI002AC35A07|nr:TetR/AcrR family transcriptional regulator [Burkholderia sp. BCC1999]
MKSWSDDHPKAKLMAAKRAAILAAAHDTFLRCGYEGTSMEGIASAAGVSIMTLYRHAKRKEDLFAAVIVNACDYSEEHKQADHEKLMDLPLQDVLTQVGEQFQDKLTRPQTVALLRIVMVETGRFPQLGDAAYKGFVGVWQDNLGDFLAQRTEFSAVSQSTRRVLVADFLNDLIGTDILRVLLGLDGTDKKQCKRRAVFAARKLLATLMQ